MARGTGCFLTLLLSLVLVVLGVLLGWAVHQRGPEIAAWLAPVPAPEPHAVVARGDLAEDERATIELFESAAPSVVFITSVVERRDFFSRNVTEIPRGTGSGFVWDVDGHVVTNFHVIQGSERARVTLNDQTTWEARLVGASPEKDLAVLELDLPRNRLTPLALGTSTDLRVGQKVFAIGNPFGLDQTLTTGIISALGREIESVARIAIREVIQTDAAINPGNSGGPLLDSAGRLIGVNTAIYSPSGAYAGIGFAIPADTVAWVVPELIAKGKIVRPTLGIEMVSAQGFRRDLEGALVIRVNPGSGADRAGLQEAYRDRSGRVRLGDVIVGIDGVPVRTSDDLLLALERRTAGEVVELTVERDGERRAVEVELGG